jgi:S-adenosylmethionine/arginine decarboxylase-like enzyme
VSAATHQADAFDHRHIVLKAAGLGDVVPDTADMGIWLLKVVDAVGMRVLRGPYVVRCETPGNVGVTGTVIIETSHCSIHVWEEAEGGPFLQFDLYSCATFGSHQVVALVRDRFAPAAISWTLIDRNGPEAEVIEFGAWEAQAS